jgi:hypothetical protein
LGIYQIVVASAKYIELEEEGIKILFRQPMKVWQGLMRDFLHLGLLIYFFDWKYKSGGFLLDNLV